jgi:pimeloyl-ACP methyl ester carboxylesterase
MMVGQECIMNGLGPTSHRFVSQRLALHYLDWGNAGAPLLVLVHGGRDHARNWDWVAQALREDWHIICPDLRGHGDSAWSPDGSYSMPFYVSDLAQLIHQICDGPVSIVAHSLGGAIALRYAGLYPERVRRLAVIEGLGISVLDKKPKAPVAERWRDWIDERRMLSARVPHRYPTLDEAFARMREANPHLSPDRIHHLTVHGTNRNEDGTYSWKFDNYVRSLFPMGITDDELHQLWHNVDCPVWLVHGADSWARHPGKDGRSARFKWATVTSYEKAGHWVHHDRFDDFVKDLRKFL